MLKISLLHAPDYMILTPKIENCIYRVAQKECNDFDR